ncbi:MAG: hypothetical protein FJZ00_07165 [Candidatus Sericytochromatia bacterium]|uniref:Uncharacterized protein n=1 Tax=Candidatus Tanganyikabacteria bacterium TaxID=2961651 RepID=A0A937X5W1_9BACT|nr:hypothetical protein [Candidatus Tanganyikabacteria bacterium]
MLAPETTTHDYAFVRPWLAWIERAISARVQFIGWSVANAQSRMETMPVILGSQHIPMSIMLLGAISEFRRSNPPESVAPGTPHPAVQVFRQTLGGVPAIVRVGSRSNPVGVLVLSNRGIVMPIQGVQARGYLVLGGRLVGTEFGEEDLPALEAACAQAAMALDRACLIPAIA